MEFWAQKPFKNIFSISDGWTIAKTWNKNFCKINFEIQFLKLCDFAYFESSTIFWRLQTFEEHTMHRMKLDDSDEEMLVFFTKHKRSESGFGH